MDRKPKNPAPLLTTVSWLAASPNAACASPKSSSAVGTSTTISPPTLKFWRKILTDPLKVYSQGALKPQDYGRDHHPRCFSMWLAGGGVKPGISYGETDDFSYNIAKDPVHIRDLHATMLHQFGFDHERLTHKFQGLEQKLTGVVPARVIRDILL